MNILDSFTPCYLTTGPFSPSAVNYNAGDCNAAAPYPAVHYTPLVVLSAIISAMMRLIDYHVVLHPWQVDKVDFCFCISAYLGVIFGSIKIGLVVAVSISALRALLFITRPRTTVLSLATSQLHGLPEDGPVCRHADGARRARPVHRDTHLLRQRQLRAREVSNAGRISRWNDKEEERTKGKGEIGVQYIVLNMGAVSSIDTSGTSMLVELRKSMDRRGMQVYVSKNEQLFTGRDTYRQYQKVLDLLKLKHPLFFASFGRLL
ncbi:unnamed protein product [Miscanthus lutarioriparius]|uniref:STAS domain-containing protein n=1 Tax=Miscanthus lutarioriparius TaxID=422564 RepID=A0A811P3X0_9POAL|nr:unnamed protein product [Miscanthus lutarioriparius]